MAATKIATCCYCGTRAALTLRGNERHELACSTCGAPLSKMKMLPAQATAPAATPARPAIDHRPPPRTRPPKKMKRKKSLKRRVLSEVWDVIEDIFD